MIYHNPQVITIIQGYMHLSYHQTKFGDIKTSCDECFPKISCLRDTRHLVMKCFKSSILEAVYASNDVHQKRTYTS